MTELTFKIRRIFNVRNLETVCCMTVDALLISLPSDIDLRDKILKHKDMRAIMISTRHEDNVSFGLYLTIQNHGSIHLHEKITFTVHENN